MKRYEELTEELQTEARRWQPKHYNKWTYSIQNKNIIFCVMHEIK